MKEQKTSKGKQIAAMAGVIILAALYVVTLIFAVLRFPGADRLFMASLFATILLPILIWIYIWLYGMLTRKKTIATLFPDAPSDEEIIEAILHQNEQEDASAEILSEEQDDL